MSLAIYSVEPGPLIAVRRKDVEHLFSVGHPKLDVLGLPPMLVAQPPDDVSPEFGALAKWYRAAVSGGCGRGSFPQPSVGLRGFAAPRQR
jgi:hypothetical protein